MAIRLSLEGLRGHAPPSSILVHHEYYFSIISAELDDSRAAVCPFRMQSANYEPYVAVKASSKGSFFRNRLLSVFCNRNCFSYFDCRGFIWYKSAFRMDRLGLPQRNFHCLPYIQPLRWPWMLWYRLNQ